MSIDTSVEPINPRVSQQKTRATVQPQETEQPTEEPRFKIIDGTKYRITCPYEKNCMAPTYNKGATIGYCSENQETNCPTYVWKAEGRIKR